MFCKFQVASTVILFIAQSLLFLGLLCDANWATGTWEKAYALMLMVVRPVLHSVVCEHVH